MSESLHSIFYLILLVSGKNKKHPRLTINNRDERLFDFKGYTFRVFIIFNPLCLRVDFIQIAFAQHSSSRLDSASLTRNFYPHKIGRQYRDTQFMRIIYDCW